MSSSLRGGPTIVTPLSARTSHVAMLSPSPDERVDLDDLQLAELERRMVEADRGEVEPAETVLASVRRPR